jgi:hypothetical protein
MKKVMKLTESDLSRIVKRVINEDEGQKSIGAIVDDISEKIFEFSEKGNDERMTFINFLLSENGPKNLAKKIYSDLKKGHNKDGFGVITKNKAGLEKIKRKIEEN